MNRPMLDSIMDVIVHQFNLTASEHQRAKQLTDEALERVIKSCFHQFDDYDVRAFSDEQLLFLKELGFDNGDPNLMTNDVTYEVACAYGIMMSPTINSTMNEALYRARKFYKDNSHKRCSEKKLNHVFMNVINTFADRKVMFITLLSNGDYAINIHTLINEKE